MANLLTGGVVESIHGSIYPLIMLAVVLGMKHGMDADHLATIDGLTRFNAAAGRKKLARLCGFLFSLGHGVVVCIVAVATSFLFQQGAVPAWMDDVGAWVSAFFLLSLGALNLYAVFTTPAHEMVQMVGLKGRWLGKLRHASHPVLIAMVGSLFAFSFDTLSQAALFSTTATQYGGVLSALLLALCFMTGMMVTDAANGLWISHLLQRADATARVASRIMGVTVALLSLFVAALGLSRRFFPGVSNWQEGRELFIGFSIIAVVAVSFLFARYTQQRASAPA
jgi:high-affinity nickel-transport protein